MHFTDQCRIISCHKSLRALCWFQKIPGIFTTDFRISIVILHASKKSAWFSSNLIPWQSLLVYVKWSQSLSERKNLSSGKTDHLLCLCKSKGETLIILEKKWHYNVVTICHLFRSCTYIFFSKLLVGRAERKQTPSELLHLRGEKKGKRRKANNFLIQNSNYSFKSHKLLHLLGK